MKPSRSRPPVPDEIYLRRRRELMLTTTGRRSGREHRVDLWFAHEGGRIYLMTYARRHGRGTDWYRNLRHHRTALIEVGERRYRGRWEDVGDPAAVLERITDLFVAKYGLQAIRSWYAETRRLPVCLSVEPTAT